MTGIPSIVAGLFAYALFAIFLGPGIRLGIMGSVALSVLMIPIVIRSAEEILKIVPNHLREAAYALGTPKWKTITRRSCCRPPSPASSPASCSRSPGSSARRRRCWSPPALIDSVNTNPFSGRMQNLAVYAYSEYKDPGVRPRPPNDRAWAAALTLILIVMILSLIARLDLPPLRNRDPLMELETECRDSRKMPETPTTTGTAEAPPWRRSSPTGRDPRRGAPTVERVAKRFEVKDVNLYYGDFHAVEDVTMTIEPNQVTALIGSSGCGKTTMLRSLNRMHELTPGARVEGEVAPRRPGHLRARTSTRSRSGGWSGWSSRPRTRSRRCRSTRTSPPA